MARPVYVKTSETKKKFEDLTRVNSANYITINNYIYFIIFIFIVIFSYLLFYIYY